MSWFPGFSLWWLFLLCNKGSRQVAFSSCGFWALQHGLCCSATCGIFADGGSNVYLLHWQADSRRIRLPIQRQKRLRFNTWVGEIPWMRKWQSNPVFLPGESHEQRRPVGYNPRGCKKSDTTEHTHIHTHQQNPTITFKIREKKF